MTRRSLVQMLALLVTAASLPIESRAAVKIEGRGHPGFNDDGHWGVLEYSYHGERGEVEESWHVICSPDGTPVAAYSSKSSEYKLMRDRYHRAHPGLRGSPYSISETWETADRMLRAMAERAHEIEYDHYSCKVRAFKTETLRDIYDLGGPDYAYRTGLPHASYHWLNFEASGPSVKMGGSTLDPKAA
jgi:hypothetical protein